MQATSMGGYASYLSRLLLFALRGSVREADKWQIVGGTALPSIIIGVLFHVAQVPVPTISAAEFPTYLGYGLIAWVAIRLLFVGPYFLYQEQLQDVAKLRLELSKPERIEHERMARARGKKKIELAALLRQLYWESCQRREPEAAMLRVSRVLKKSIKLMGQANVSDSFGKAFAILHDYAFKSLTENDTDAQFVSHALINNMLDYLHGKITAEDLALRLPPSIGSEKPQ